MVLLQNCSSKKSCEYSSFCQRLILINKSFRNGQLFGFEVKKNCNDGDNVLTHYKKNQAQNNKKLNHTFQFPQFWMLLWHWYTQCSPVGGSNATEVWITTHKLLSFLIFIFIYYKITYFYIMHQITALINPGIQAALTL